jgi:hypothetical protein
VILRLEQFFVKPGVKNKVTGRLPNKDFENDGQKEMQPTPGMAFA